MRMLIKEILQDRDEKLGIVSTLVLIQGVGVLRDNDVRVRIEEVFAVKGNVPNNP